MTIDSIREQVVRVLRDGANLRLELADKQTDAIMRAITAVTTCFRRGGRLLLFGNGGSAADAQHIAAEFVGRFLRDREPLPATALTTDTSILTAIGNDFGFDQIFARQVQAMGRVGDVAIAISTSGRSPNVLAGVEMAKRSGLVTIGLAGGDGGRLAEIVEISIVVPSSSTARTQECHIAIGHILCEGVESLLTRSNKDRQRDESRRARPSKGTHSDRGGPSR